MKFEVSRLIFRHGKPKRCGQLVEPLLKDLSFQIPAGSVVTVFGVNGSGKSTLMNFLGLLSAPWKSSHWEGDVYYHGASKKTSYRDLGSQAQGLRRSEFGFVMQAPYLLPHLNCRDNIALPLALTGASKQDCHDAIDQLLSQFSSDFITHLKRKLMSRTWQVSGGEQQQMAVLRALICNPTVVFADEPFNNLDLCNRPRVEQLLTAWSNKGKSKGRTLILVSHEPVVSWPMTDLFLLLREGRLIGGELLPKSILIEGPRSIDLLLSEPFAVFPETPAQVVKVLEELRSKTEVCDAVVCSDTPAA